MKPSRRLFLSEEDEGLAEGASYKDDDVASEELYAADESDAAILAGRHHVGDFRESAGMMGTPKPGGGLGTLLDKPTAFGSDRSKPMPATMGFGRPAVPGKEDVCVWGGMDGNISIFSQF